MKRGLVIGKFMPLHTGHIALIHFAASQCDELIVSMTYKPDDPIPGPLRFEWIKEEFQDQSAIQPTLSPDDFDDESATLEQRIPRWVAFLKKRFSPIDVVFSSEEYGVRLAESLGVLHISFDQGRKKFPISSTMILERPLKYWDFIGASARSYFVRRICFYGPESTGKSTLAKRMAAVYATEFVPEVSREMITSNNFTLDDIIKIGHAQTERVLEKSKVANKLLFCDTDLITTQIYCRHYLKKVPPILFELEKKITYDRYFLFDTDVPWVADGLRDLGDRRREMFEVFKGELDKRKIPYQLLRGDFSVRESRMIKELNKYFD